MSEMREALRSVRDGMLRGEYVHNTDEIIYTCGKVVGLEDLMTVKGPRQFNMRQWAYMTDCGTCGCIGGWTEVELGRALTAKEDNDAYDLFYSYVDSEITPLAAAKAINRFLNDQKPWPKEER